MVDSKKEKMEKNLIIVVENRHDGINEHNVPDEVMETMRKKFNIKL